MADAVTSSCDAPSFIGLAGAQIGLPTTALAAMLTLALGPHGGMLSGAAHAMMRIAADIIVGSDGAGAP